MSDRITATRSSVLRRCAGALVFFGTAALAVSAALDGRLPVIVFVTILPAASWQQLTCWIVAAVALAALARPDDRVPPLLVGCSWLIAALVTSLTVMRETIALTAFVAPAECLLLGLVALAYAAGRRAPARLNAAVPICAAATLILFGLIHLTRVDEIAALVPHWAPFRPLVPIATGALLMVFGIGVAWERSRPAAALLAAALFLSWLPLVHAARIAADPASAFEWQFALMAVSLAGSLMAVASRPAGAAAIVTARRIGTLSTARSGGQ